MKRNEGSIQRVGKAGGWAATIGTMILLTEVIWMVLPFVGFISLHVTIDPFFQYCRRWFRPFFMPSYSPAGAPLVLLGLGVFFSGAIQIYGSKLRGGGAVTRGLYRWVRHPQYTALIITGIGLLLLWPRYYLLLAFCTMCFLYYGLARIEERAMIQSHGDTYRSYWNATSAFIPGDRHLLRLSEPGPMTLRGFLAGLGTWIVAMILVFALGFAASAYTITHRGLPTVEKHGMIALERRVFFKDLYSESEFIHEFFGKRILQERLRRKEHVRENVGLCLGLLSMDERVQSQLDRIESPFTVIALPINPRGSQFPIEQRPEKDSGARLYRIYLAAAADSDNGPLPNESAFNGYLRDKKKKLLLSTLVNPQKRTVLQAVSVPFSKGFVDMFDRLMDKETF